MVETWNDTWQAYPETATAPGLFEDQAAKMPDGVALMFEGEMLSYKELLECSSRLACCLRQYEEGEGATAYSKLSAARLKELCVSRGIVTPKKVVKSGVIRLLEEADSERGGGGDDEVW